MDLNGATNLKIIGYKKKAIPVHYQKRYKANHSNSTFNQSFAIGAYKQRIKSLLKNNRCLVAEVQNYKCEQSSQERMLAQASTVNLDHIFSARLKLNKLAEVLKESYLSIEEILSLLELCSSTYHSRFASNRRSSQNKLKRSLVNSLVKPIAEVEELLLTPDICTDVPCSNQGGDIPVPPSNHKEGTSICADSTGLSSRPNSHESCRETLQQFSRGDECAKPVAATSNVPKASFNVVLRRNARKANKAYTVSKTRKRITNKRKSSESKVGYKPNSPTQVQSPSNPPQITEAIPVDENIPVLQDNGQTSLSKKKRKLLVPQPIIIEKSSQPKLAPKKGKIKNTLHTASENVCNENVADIDCHDQAMSEVQDLKTGRNIYNIRVDHSLSNLREHIEQDKAQFPCHPSSSSTLNKNLLNPEYNAESASNVVALSQKHPKPDESINVCPLNNLNKSDEGKVIKGVPKDSSKLSTNKSKSRCKVTYHLDSEIIVKLPNEKRCKMSNQRKRISYPKMRMISEDGKNVHFDYLPSGIPILQSLENISCLNENLSKNILVVSAEIHPPPPHCAPFQIRPTSPKHIKNLQPCVVLTDVSEAKRVVVRSTSDSSENSSSGSETVKESKDAKSSKSQKNKNSDSERSHSCNQSERIPRHRTIVSYKEPSLMQKLRKV